MDDARFDRLTRTLAGGTHRRGLLGLAATLPLLGGVLALLDPEDGEAKGRHRKKKQQHDHRQHDQRQRDVSTAKKRKKQQQKKKKCKPQPKTKTCKGRCGPVQNNCQQTVDCGACQCDPSCPRCCNGVCCSGANAICHAATGACCLPDADEETCDEQCGKVANNCGVEVECPPCPCPGGCGEHGTCQVAAGACVCDPGYQTCSPKPCDTHLLTDPGNCGACGKVCESGICHDGECGCPGDQTKCGDHCTNLQSDPNNCGQCGLSCSTGNCQAGTCQCSLGTVECSGQCRSVTQDPTNCGACGNVCPGNGQHGQATCSNGECSLACEAGWADCNANANDSCETPLGTLTDCLACGDSCTHVADECSDPICTVLGCGAQTKNEGGSCQGDTGTCINGTCVPDGICIESLQACVEGGTACCEGRTCQAFQPGCWGPQYCCRGIGESCTNACDCCSTACAFFNGGQNPGTCV